MRAFVLIMLAVAMLETPGAASDCLRPAPPIEPAPEDDTYTRALIEEDIQRYFSEIQIWFNCMARQRRDIEAEVQDVISLWQRHFGDEK